MKNESVYSFIFDFLESEAVAAAAYNKNRDYYDYPPAAVIVIAATVIKTTHELIPPLCYYIMSPQKGMLL